MKTFSWPSGVTTKQAAKLRNLWQVRDGASSQALQSPMETLTRRGPRTEVKTGVDTGSWLWEQWHAGVSSYLISCRCHAGQTGEAANSFLATLASSSSEEMEAELLERVESSQKQANHVVEIYECLKSTVDQLKAEVDSGVGEIKRRIQNEIAVMEIFIWEEFIESVFTCSTHKNVIIVGVAFLSRGQPVAGSFQTELSPDQRKQATASAYWGPEAEAQPHDKRGTKAIFRLCSAPGQDILSCG